MLYGHGGNVASVVEKYGLAIDMDRVTDFSVSTSLMKYPEGLEKIICESVQSISHYPDVDSAGLRDSIARYHNADKGNVVVGSGSTELLYLVPRAFGIKRAISAAPSYLDYRDAVEYSGGKMCYFYLDERNDFSFDVERLTGEAWKYDAVFLCHPNNPTGRLLPVGCLTGVIRKMADTLFVIDEAYLPMTAGGEKASFITATPPENLVILRSMTKSFAIPGLRLGYAFAAETVVARLYRYKEPWTVNVFAQVAGEYLVRKEAWLRKSAEKIGDERERLKRWLSSFSKLKIFPSDANFLLLKIISKKFTAKELLLALLKKGIFVRDCSNYPGLSQNYFRVAVKTREENNLLVSALGEVFKEALINDG